MERWSIEETNYHVQLNYSKEQSIIFNSIAQSVVRRLHYVAYHYQLIETAFNKFNHKHSENDTPLIISISSTNKSRQAFNSLMLECEANATACVLSIHSIGDLLANMVYHGLGLNLSKNKIAPSKVNLHRVLQILNKSTEYAEISETLSDFKDSQSYVHVAALSNMSKHQSIVKLQYTQDVVSLDQPKLTFSAFQRGKQQHYPQIEILDLLDPAYRIADSTIISIGKMLSMTLKQKTAASVCVPAL